MPSRRGYNPLEVEREVSEFWERERIFEKVVELRKGGKVFAFLEGPPTANGFMHVGHARGRTMKDVVLRFKTMQGYDVWRRAGWDCHGLPVELEVEKLLGVKTKPDIVEKIGVERFIEECKKLVDYYIDHWVKASKRLGLWLDYDTAYETRRDDYIEFVWWALKRAYERGLMVEDYRVVPQCPRCQTSLSSHEVALGYKEREDPSIYVKFKLKGSERDYLLVWTTTPWTLPANLAVAVHPDYDYVKVRVGGETWVVAEGRLEAVMQEIGVKEYEVVGRVKGSELKGLEYVPPLLEEVPRQGELKGEWLHRVVTADFVTLEEGTGLVHIAPAHGPEDFELGREYGLPVFNPVDAAGRFTEDGGKYKGMLVFNANPVIVEDLRRKGLLVWAGTVKHSYPHCWRCDTPLIYRADKQWFLRVGPIKRLMLEENEQVYWNPRWAGKERFGDWIANAEDWCISRSRFWGTPLPVWRCRECGHVEVIGSREELKAKAIKLPGRLELHRPWIDSVVLKCPKCGAEMYREPYVVDVWLDSGVAHAASVGYLKDKSLFDRLFPYDFITEAVDQTRGWFYTLLFTSVMLFEKAPYKSVLCQGHVLDKYGRKMSKSKGNVIWAMDMMERKGADPLRLYLLIKAAPWDSPAFDPDELDNVIRDLNVVWNVFYFAKSYMELDRFDPRAHPLEELEQHLRVEDRWIISRVNTLVKRVTEDLEVYNLHTAARAILEFALEDVSRTYIRLIRRRVWVEEESPDKLAAYATLFYVLWKLVRLLAPFTPYLAEHLYREFILPLMREGPESVHMTDWPEVGPRDEELEKSFDIVRSIVAAAAAARQKAGLKLRWPVPRVLVSPKTFEAKSACEKLLDVLKEQVNAKEVKVLKVEELPPEAKLVVKPKYEVLGPRLRRLAPAVYKALSDLPEEGAKKLSSGLPVKLVVEGVEVEVRPEEVEVVVELPSYMKSHESKHGVVYVDARLSDELKAEAIARELVRRIQIMRKELDLKLDEYVNVVVGLSNEEALRLAERFKGYVASEVRARELVLAKLPLEKREDYYWREWNLEDYKAVIGIQRLAA